MLWALQGSGRSSSGVLQSSGDWLLIAWGWGFAVCFAVYVTGGISGAHLNPAISLGAAIRKQLPWNKVAPYWAAQVLGAFMGAALVFLVYNNAINHFDQVGHCATVIGTVTKPCVPIVKGTPASLGTYSTFATFPAPKSHSRQTDMTRRAVTCPNSPTTPSAETLRCRSLSGEFVTLPLPDRSGSPCRRVRTRLPASVMRSGPCAQRRARNASATPRCARACAANASASGSV